MNYPRFDNQYVFENFMRPPHARRMICAMIHVLPKEQIRFEATMHEYLAEPRNREKLRHLIRGSAPAASRPFRDIFEEGADSYNSFDSEECRALVVLAQNPLTTRLSGLTVSDLASPMLKEGAIRNLFGLPISREAKVVLGTNPNCPRELVQPARPEDMYNVALGAARYGDLEDNSTVELVENHLLREATPANRRYALGALLRRKNVSSLMAAVMDKYVNGKEYASLAQMDGHRDYIREKHDEPDVSVSVADIFTADKELKIPVGLRSWHVKSLFYNKQLTTPGEAKTRALLALHPNASIAVVNEALNIPRIREHMSDAAIGSESPHAEWIIEKCDTDSSSFVVATLPNASPAGLLKAAGKGVNTTDVIGLEAALTHPNFPWSDTDHTELMDEVPSAILDVVLVARALYKAPDVKSIPEAATKVFPSAMLFSPGMSARQIEKLVEKHPELAPLAACHPNGYDVVVDNKEQRAIVGKFRAKFQAPTLAGKTVAGESNSIPHVMEL